MKFIALCGYPETGKSTVQDILNDLAGVIPVDDAKPFREVAKMMYGLTDFDVSTQKGKSSYINVCGEKIQIRKIIGDIGTYFEEKHGTEFKAELAVKNALKNPEYNDDTILSFGSCRLNQGHVYKRNGGIVVEVLRDGKKANHDFDIYDKSAVDITLYNNSSIEDLKQQIIDNVIPLIHHQPSFKC